MRLDPVYLLAPKPRPPSIPTRRAFLLMGCAFVGGTALGGACGYSIGAVKGEEEPQGDRKAEEPGEITWENSGDAELEELRRLAVKAPIDELMGKAGLFLVVRVDTYREDLILWRGVERIAEELQTNPLRDAPRYVIATAAAQITKSQPSGGASLKHLLPALQRRLAGTRRGK